MYRQFFLFFLLLISSSLKGDLTDYFKKAAPSPRIHRLRNIDFIYTINLDQRPEKFQDCVDQLKPYGIYPYRFSAVNGWELSLKAINDVGIKYQKGMREGLMATYYPPDGNFQQYHEVAHVEGRTYFCHCMARGPIGIALSHLSVLQDAYDKGYKTIWVMEDDIQIIQNPTKLSTVIEQLDALVGKDGWDVLFTDRDTKDRKGNYVPCLGYALKLNFDPPNPERFRERTDAGKDFIKIGARYGTYSMIVRRSGMKKILNHFKSTGIFLPYDMEFNLPEGMRIYAVKDDIVSTIPTAISDNGAPRYKEKMISK